MSSKLPQRRDSECVLEKQAVVFGEATAKELAVANESHFTACMMTTEPVSEAVTRAIINLC